MKRGLVSILIVSYNAEDYIEKTVMSCLNQTYLGIEILLLDNVSTDQKVAIVRELDHPRISIFEGAVNIGPYAGLNFLLDRSKGEYVAIQDHDDVWFPEKIDAQRKFMEKNPEYVACGTRTYDYYENQEVFVLSSSLTVRF
jgi:teichuronic acid biosynthesis glycosyltransferase TuaG